MSTRSLAPTLGLRAQAIRGKQILVVEDDPRTRTLLGRVLTEAGCVVTEIAEGRAAIDFLVNHVPDLVCLDLMLPEVSGHEICRFIRRTPALKDVPIVVISARTLPEDLAYARDIGASAYLVKPFKLQELFEDIAALL
jgi:DNA-binding response OmpR family regulator